MELRRRALLSIAIGVLALAAVQTARAQNFITVASTTSTEQSGLFKHMLPAFQKKTGIEVRVVALGTGQALDMARRGDADVVFVHAKASEEKFIAEGHGVPSRFLVQILLQLKSAGLVQSIRGAAGGYQLAKEPEEISLLDVMNVIDPEVVVIGGGVGNIDLLYTEGVEEVKRYIFNSGKCETLFLQPKLGDSAGVFGAALLCA